MLVECYGKAPFAFSWLLDFKNIWIVSKSSRSYCETYLSRPVATAAYLRHFRVSVPEGAVAHIGQLINSGCFPTGRK